MPSGGPPITQRTSGLVGPIEALIRGSAEERLQLGAKLYGVVGADMGIKGAHVPENLDQLKMIICPFLGYQNEGIHSAIVEAVVDERLEQRLRLSHELRIYVDMRNDNDLSKPVGMSGRTHQARGND